MALLLARLDFCFATEYQLDRLQLADVNQYANAVRFTVPRGLPSRYSFPLGSNVLPVVVQITKLMEPNAPYEQYSACRTSARSEPAMNILLHAEHQLREVAGARR